MPRRGKGTGDGEELDLAARHLPIDGKLLKTAANNARAACWRWLERA